MNSPEERIQQSAATRVIVVDDCLSKCLGLYVTHKHPMETVLPNGQLTVNCTGFSIACGD